MQDGAESENVLDDAVGSSGDTQAQDDGGIELWIDGRMHGLRNRQGSSMKIVAINEASIQENNPRISNESGQRENLKSKFHNNNQFRNLGEFFVSKREKKAHVHETIHGTRGSSSDGNKEKECDRNNESSEQDGGCCGFGGMLLSCAGAGTKRLLHVKEMPDHLQFNTYVHTGYRDLQGAWDCFMSLFYFHNETVNILTHLIPIIGVLYYWRSMFPWDDVEGHLYFNFLGWSHVTGSITPWLGSVTYHTFMNHHRGAGFYKFLLQLDMLGIWVTQAFGALTNLTASTWCLSDETQQFWLGTYAIASAWGLYKALTADSALGRRMCFALCFASRLLGFMLRISTYGGGDPAVLTHVVLQDIISIAGGFIGVIRIPELWFPGRLDLFFNSHHIMHVMVVMAVFHMNCATNGDIRWILKNYSKFQCVTLI